MPSVEESAQIAADMLREEQARAEFRRAVVSLQQRLEATYGHVRWPVARRELLHSQGLFLSPWRQQQELVAGRAVLRYGQLVAADPVRYETVWARRLRRAAALTEGKPEFTLEAAREHLSLSAQGTAATGND